MLNNITMLSNTIFRNKSTNQSVDFGMSLCDENALVVIKRGRQLKLKPITILGNIYFNYTNTTTIPDTMVLDIIEKMFKALKDKGMYSTKDILTVSGLENIADARIKFVNELNTDFNNVDIDVMLKHLEFVAKTVDVDVSYYPTVCVNNPLMTLNEFFKGDVTFYGFNESLSMLLRVDQPITRCDVEISTRCDWKVEAINRVVNSVIENALNYRVIKEDSLTKSKWDTVNHRQQMFKEMLKNGYKDIEPYKFGMLNKHVCYYLTEKDLIC